jgi:hypothetical protein
MADKVQLTLETLVPEMDVLIQKGYFTKKDAKKIMKKRRYHEYQFEKTDVLPLDYFKAIKYEKILNKRMKQQKKNLHIKKKDYYDFHFIRRIIVLYKKCLIKFNNNDENIWMEYFNFLLVNKCNEILNKEIGRCLTLHPSKIIFWKIAAYHEYEDNLNFQNARNLLQKCIKFNQFNVEAYLEYFTFEIIFAKNFVERKDILSGKKTEEKKETKKKINIINDINEEKEKMEIDEEKNDNDDIINNNNNNDIIKTEVENDKIRELVIPELIYDDCLQKLIIGKNKKVEEILEIHFGFLERLEKYGSSKQINYQKLENKIMNNIKNLINNNAQNSILCIDNEIKMIKIKLLKYSKEEVINRIKIVYKEFENNLFIEKYINYNNYISYHFLKYFLIDEEKQENNDSYLEELIKIIKPKIDINKLITDLLSFNNIKLLMIISSKEYLIDNLLKTYNFDINTKIFDIINTIFQKNDLSALKDIFVIVNNIKNEISSLVENITKLPLKYEENEICLNFMEYYIEKIIELIKDEVTYYIKPELMKSYFELINNQFLIGKVNYVIMKKLYYKMIELIVDKSIQINENDKNEDGKKYYGDSYKYIKENMEKLLINRKEIIKDIINKKENNKNKFQFLNWID